MDEEVTSVQHAETDALSGSSEVAAGKSSFEQESDEVAVAETGSRSEQQEQQQFQETSRAPKSQSFMFMVQGDAVPDTGVLSSRGFAALKRREQLMGVQWAHVLRESIAAIDQLWVAPEKAALHSAIRIVSKVWLQMGNPAIKLPYVRMIPELRPVFRDVRLDGVGEYLMSTVLPEVLSDEMLPPSFLSGEKRSGWEAKVRTWVEDIKNNVLASTGHAVLRDNFKPRCWVQIFDYVHEVKKELASTSELARKQMMVMMVAGSDFASYLFQPFLPSTDPEDQDKNRESMQRRNVMTLNQAAILHGWWKELEPTPRGFVKNPIYKYRRVTYPLLFDITISWCTACEEDLPSLLPPGSHIGRKDMVNLPFDGRGYVGTEVAGKLPEEVEWYCFYFEKRKRFGGMKVGKWSKPQRRLVYLILQKDRPGPILYPRAGWVTWLTEMGDEHKATLDITKVKVQLNQPVPGAKKGSMLAQSSITMRDDKDTWLMASKFSGAGQSKAYHNEAFVKIVHRMQEYVEAPQPDPDYQPVSKEDEASSEPEDISHLYETVKYDSIDSPVSSDGSFDLDDDTTEEDERDYMNVVGSNAGGSRVPGPKVDTASPYLEPGKVMSEGDYLTPDVELTD